MGVRGPRSDAVDMLQSIRKMLADSLKLDLIDKSKITMPRIEPALFLGTLISKYESSTTGRKILKTRVSQLRMLAPMDRIYKKLTIAGFMSGKYKSGIPKFI